MKIIKRLRSLGQSVLEYVLLVILIIFVFVAMKVYMVRGVQDKYRQSADVFGQGEQYERGVTEVNENIPSFQE